MGNSIIYLYKEVFHNVLKYKSIGELIDKIGLLYANSSKWELNMSSVEAAPLPEYPKGAFLIDLSVMPGINEARREYTNIHIIWLPFMWLRMQDKQRKDKPRHAKIPIFHNLFFSLSSSTNLNFLEKWGFFSINI